MLETMVSFLSTFVPIHWLLTGHSQEVTVPGKFPSKSLPFVKSAQQGSSLSPVLSVYINNLTQGISHSQYYPLRFVHNLQIYRSYHPQKLLDTINKLQGDLGFNCLKLNFQKLQVIEIGPLLNSIPQIPPLNCHDSASIPFQCPDKILGVIFDLSLDFSTTIMVILCLGAFQESSRQTEMLHEMFLQIHLCTLPEDLYILILH